MRVHAGVRANKLLSSKSVLNRNGRPHIEELNKKGKCDRTLKKWKWKFCQNPTQHQLTQLKLKLDTIINPNPPQPPTHTNSPIGQEDSGMKDRGFSSIESSYSYH